MNGPLKHLLQKNPYYPYNQEWFGHNKEDTPNLVEDDWLIDSLYLSGLYNGQNATIFTPGEVFTIVFLLAHANDDVLKKKICKVEFNQPSCWLYSVLICL